MDTSSTCPDPVLLENGKGLITCISCDLIGQAMSDLALLHSPPTWRAYRKEAERFLAWAVIERAKAISSLKTSPTGIFWLSRRPMVDRRLPK